MIFENAPALPSGVSTIIDGKFDVGRGRLPDVMALVARDGATWNAGVLDVYWVGPLFSRDLGARERGWTPIPAVADGIGQGEKTFALMGTADNDGTPTGLDKCILAHEIGHALTNWEDPTQIGTWNTAEHVIFPRFGRIDTVNYLHAARIPPRWTNAALKWRATGQGGREGSQLLVDWN